jgi:hypothetical protein
MPRRVRRSCLWGFECRFFEPECFSTRMDIGANRRDAVDKLGKKIMQKSLFHFTITSQSTVPVADQKLPNTYNDAKLQSKQLIINPCDGTMPQTVNAPRPPSEEFNSADPPSST